MNKPLEYTFEVQCKNQGAPFFGDWFLGYSISASIRH
jgi:hypothetical protein